MSLSYINLQKLSKKINIKPNELNKNINEIIYSKLKELNEGYCIDEGYIIKNSIEAVSKIPNPLVTVSLEKIVDKIYIKVIDNGVGIDDNKISRLFEPYYTTKEKGTGLGLSIVKKIIEDHDGSIKIEKNKNMAGTTTSIILI